MEKLKIALENSMETTDYQKFTKKSTPKQERERLGIGDIYSNVATCLICNETIRSKNRHDYRKCKCGNLSVDGGSWYLRRGIRKKDSFKNKVEYYDDVVLE